jgi:predicted house-cleaning noncanonical NTP pyrophosphatase (MazG superfamily)
MLNIASKFQQDNPDLSDEDFKEKLIEKYCEEYKGLMTKKQIKEQTADWIDYI